MGKSRKNSARFASMFIEAGNERQQSWFDSLPESLPLAYLGTLEDEDGKEYGDIWEIQMPRIIGSAYAKKARSLQKPDCPVDRVV